MQRLQGKTILITGATSGLGEAMAHCFAEEGASIVAVGRNHARGETLIDALTARHAAIRAQFFPCDLTDAHAIGDLQVALPSMFSSIMQAFSKRIGSKKSPLRPMTSYSERM